MSSSTCLFRVFFDEILTILSDEKDYESRMSLGTDEEDDTDPNVNPCSTTCHIDRGTKE
jgi:hypothetical protein